MVYRRKLNLIPTFESGSSYFGFKRIVPSAFNMGLIGSTCTTLPWQFEGLSMYAVPMPSIRGLHSFPFQLNLSSSVHRITQINS